MKKSIIAAAAALFIAGMANADYTGKYDGIVKFAGEVVNQTCKVDVETGLGKREQTVELPKVSKDKFTQKGDVAGTTPFNINLVGCTKDVQPQAVKAQFVFNDQFVDVDNNYTLKNTSTEADFARNVNLQLTNSDPSRVIYIGRAGGQGIDDGVIATDLRNEETATLRYNVQYYATDANVSAGKVASQVEYNIVYE